mgnify:CR=1 FL=1
MSARFGKESVKSRGATARNDGLHPINGGSSLPVSGVFSSPQNAGFGTGQTNRGDARDVAKAPWFNPIERETSSDDRTVVMECKDGVCPVPWAVEPTPAPVEEHKAAVESSPYKKEDLVNHPSHYTEGEIECIEAIEAALTPEEFRGYCKGNLMKYGWRERHKGGTESLRKGQWYLDRLIKFDEAQKG